MRILHIILALLLGVVLGSCKKSEPHYQPMYVSNMQPHLYISISNERGEDISSRVIGSRLLSFRGETNEPLYLDQHKLNHTWILSADMPNHKNVKKVPETGDHFSSRLLISSAKNNITLRCVFRYSRIKSDKPLYGGEGLSLVRVETEQGKVIAERKEGSGQPHLRLKLEEGLVSVIE